MSALVNLTSKTDFDAFTAKPELSLVHFYASWAPQCNQLNTVLSDLLEDLSGTPFTAAYIDAEEVAEVSRDFKIKAAPVVIFFKGGKEISRQDGFKPADLRVSIISLSAGAPLPVPAAAKGEDLNDRLKSLINAAPLMLFMKGDPDAPRCGFSRQVVALLNEFNLAYKTFDILGDNEVREGLKVYSNWPTYPQLYHNGELLGGLDVIREELKDADFVASLPTRN